VARPRPGASAPEGTFLSDCQRIIYWLWSVFAHTADDFAHADRRSRFRAPRGSIELAMNSSAHTFAGAKGIVSTSK